ncbi:MAG: serine hydrolase [Myxococcota bacterium]
MRTRRSVLSMIGCTVGAASLGLPLARPALAADGSWDISYFWAPDRDAVLDYKETVADALGTGVAKHLAVVQGKSGNWGLVYDRTGTDRAAAERVAATHDRLLRASIGGRETLATVIRDQTFSRLHNVGYGTLTSLTSAKARYHKIVRLLGPDVHKDLVVEQVSKGRFQVVYRRLGDPQSTSKVASRHAAVLKKYGIPAASVGQRHADPVWGSGSGGTVHAEHRATPPAHAAVAAKVESTRKHAVEVVAPRRPAAPPAIAGGLPASIATPLRDAINTHVQGLRKRGVILPDETTSWYVHTLNDNRTWAAINAERSLQCASMVKPYVALAFLHQVSKGRIVYGPVSKAKLEAMIQRSSNSSTNWAISKVGGPKSVQRILDAHYGHILKETSIVESIPTQGRTYKNRSSARDYVRFSKALWAGKLPKSAEIKRLMALPGRDRLKTGAPHIPAGTKVMNKTGTTSHLCGDFGILVAKTRKGKKVPYAIVGIIEKKGRAPSFSAWSSSRGRIIRGVSDLTYGVLKQHYGLV